MSVDKLTITEMELMLKERVQDLLLKEKAFNDTKGEYQNGRNEFQSNILFKQSSVIKNLADTLVILRKNLPIDEL